MNVIRRAYIEKKEAYAVKSEDLLKEIRGFLGIGNVNKVRILIRYDIQGITDDIYCTALNTILAEPPVDRVYDADFPMAKHCFAVEYLPGQFDQRADSLEQCLMLLGVEKKPIVKTAVVYLIEGDISDEEMNRIKHFCINPVDSREASLQLPKTLNQIYEVPTEEPIIEKFILWDLEQLYQAYQDLNLAMTFEDFKHIQAYFRDDEKRDPVYTEIKVLDTYWSDHCRHTTFLTELKEVTIQEGFYNEPVLATYKQYLHDRQEVHAGSDKYPSLMDIALLGMRKLRKEGKLRDLEESDEINACCIIVPVKRRGEVEEWIVSFKNETHNHPTEIEPFGGAATCLGGAIRDPLSGRTYVYQGMRVTGAGDPRTPQEECLLGKLPQKKLTNEAAHGFSSYGNQIGLATGLVKEIYHPGYVAKRMEIGAVIGAAPRANIRREDVLVGDRIILLGGRTGRDGCGGATGSSKVHTEESILTCGAEVQKGNAPTERKIQRMFRNKEVSRLIKKCNDFGAGGVAVAIGELAEGLVIDLDKVLKKYDGLTGTELAISESQERMAVVVSMEDAKQFIEYAKAENLEAVEVAQVTDTKRLVMLWNGQTIVNLKRAFLDTNGAHQETNVDIQAPMEADNPFNDAFKKCDVKINWIETLKDLNICSQKGLVEQFDSSIGASTVLMPYGGQYQDTEAQVMAAKLPVDDEDMDTATLMSYGFDPYLSSFSPYYGAVYSVVHSIAKIVAAGGNYASIRLTFQEYFKRLLDEPKRWGEPLSALLGAYEAQIKLGVPAIGGKDSMSGSFHDLDVPPTLVSFAVGIEDANKIITNELKQTGSKLGLIKIIKDDYDLPNFEMMKKNYAKLYHMAQEGKILSAYALGKGGICEGISKMAFGNRIGVLLSDVATLSDIFGMGYGNLLIEVANEEVITALGGELIGETNSSDKIQYKDMEVLLKDGVFAWKQTLEDVFPTGELRGTEIKALESQNSHKNNIVIKGPNFGTPQVFIPIFPGTNCEIDSARAFEAAGAKVRLEVFNNLSNSDIHESIQRYEVAIKESQIIMFPGGFSALDEPDGSGKFIGATFRNRNLKNAIHELLRNRDGLILGICNGFQALIKLGLLPYGEIITQHADSPTLTMNKSGKHISKMVYTKISSNLSPWYTQCDVDKIYATPISHGEGRFVANETWINRLTENGQIASQYVDLQGNPTMDTVFNPNGSYYAIEGITSADGRILGKMAHVERRGKNVAKNIYGNMYQHIFESGVAYFKG